MKIEVASNEKKDPSSLKVGRKLIRENNMPSFVGYVRKALEKMNLDNEKVKKKWLISANLNKTGKIIYLRM